MKPTHWHLLRAEVWERDEGVCGICAEPADPTKWDLDHITPLSEGGTLCLDNVRVSHPLCNRKSGGRLGAERRFHTRPANLGQVMPLRPCLHCGKYIRIEFVNNDESLLVALRETAETDGRSLNGEIIYALRDWLRANDTRLRKRHRID